MSDSDEPKQPTRRLLIQRVAGTAAVAVFPVFGQNPPPENHHSASPVTKDAAEEHHYQHFRPEHLTTLDALVETIIPTDEHSPGAKEARVSEYIDAIVADAPEAVKHLWDDGLTMVNRLAVTKFSKPYADCSAEQQFAILTEMAGDESHREMPEQRFFLTLKRATVDGYYTSRIGIHDDLQYQGNQAQMDFPGCTHTEAS